MLAMTEIKPYFIWRHVLMCAVFVIAVSVDVRAVLLSGPKNYTAVVGSTAMLSCSSDLPHAVTWTLTRSESSKPVDIYEGDGILTASFRERFSVQKGSGGFQNLTITNVSFTDAGTYTCIDNSGFGSTTGHLAHAELRVSDVLASFGPPASESPSAAIIITIVITIVIIIVILIIAAVLILCRDRLRNCNFLKPFLIGGDGPSHHGNGECEVRAANESHPEQERLLLDAGTCSNEKAPLSVQCTEPSVPGLFVVSSGTSPITKATTDTITAPITTTTAAATTLHITPITAGDTTRVTTPGTVTSLPCAPSPTPIIPANSCNTAPNHHNSAPTSTGPGNSSSAVIPTSDSTPAFATATRTAAYKDDTGRLSSTAPPKDQDEAMAAPENKNKELVNGTFFMISTDGNAVRGVTIISDQLFILCHYTLSISIYNTRPPYEIIREMAKIEELKDPGDMAGCEKHKFLYISDLGNSCIHRLSCSGNGLAVRLNNIQPAKPGMLSVTNEGELLLATADATISLYSSQGVLLKALKIPKGIDHVQHVIKSAFSNYFISYGKPAKVCEIYWKEDAVTPGGWTSDDVLQTSSLHLALNGVEGVFVAGSTVQGLLALNTGLQECAVLVEELRAIERPLRSFCAQEKCLVIGTSDCAYVYNISAKKIWMTKGKLLAEVQKFVSQTESKPDNPEHFQAQVAQLIRVLHDEINDRHTLETVVNKIIHVSMERKAWLELGARTCASLCDLFDKNIESTDFKNIFLSRIQMLYKLREKLVTDNLPRLLQFTKFLTHVTIYLRASNGSIYNLFEKALTNLVGCLMNQHKEEVIQAIDQVVRLIEDRLKFEAPTLCSGVIEKLNKAQKDEGKNSFSVKEKLEYRKLAQRLSPNLN